MVGQRQVAAGGATWAKCALTAAQPAQIPDGVEPFKQAGSDGFWVRETLPKTWGIAE